MATHQEMHDSLLNFQELHNENAQLQKMNKDWNRTMLVQTTDTNDLFTIDLQNGVVTIAEGAPQAYQMALIADSETLCNLFFGEIGPTQPYMDGTLKVKGTEEDVLRLDFVTAMIWGE
jgi:putative sterol carrier protein